MRWTLFVLLMLPALLPLAGADEQWGCCVPPYGLCFDSSAYDSESAFQGACTSAGNTEHPATIEGAGVAATCNPFSQCTVGCCCAGPEVFDGPTINTQEELTRITQAA